MMPGDIWTLRVCEEILIPADHRVFDDDGC